MFARYTSLLQVKDTVGGTELLTMYFEINEAGEGGTAQSDWQNLTLIDAQSAKGSLWVWFRPNGGSGSPVDVQRWYSIAGVKLPYTLTASPDSGSQITVSRQSTAVAATGNVPSGGIIYEDDSLKISVAPLRNYGITGLYVNGAAFTSGNTHAVSGNVSVTATSQILASDVGATDADIESTSTITIARYDSSYVHSLHYSFGSLSGYLTAAGGISSTEVKITGTSVAFAIPASFYAEIPNAASGTCTITCRTYASTTSTDVLGEPTTCTFTVRASESLCGHQSNYTFINR